MYLLFNISLAVFIATIIVTGCLLFVAGVLYNASQELKKRAERNFNTRLRSMDYRGEKIPRDEHIRDIQ